MEFYFYGRLFKKTVSSNVKFHGLIGPAESKNVIANMFRTATIYIELLYTSVERSSTKNVNLTHKFTVLVIQISWSKSV
jgi:hypothetical protein